MTTITALIDAYLTDPTSAHHAKRYRSRIHAAGVLNIIRADMGDRAVGGLRTRDFLLAHQQWAQRGVTMGHTLATQFRTLIRFGATYLEDDDCAKLAVKLSGVRIKNGKPRTVVFTAAQVIAIRRKAHAMNYHSVALAAAFCFELMMRPKDAIGEWVPVTEPCRDYLVTKDGWKWWYGIRFEEISPDLILTHTQSKRGKEMIVNLAKATMVMEELQNRFTLMSELPKHGPVIICEDSQLPWRASTFRPIFRKIASAAGIPDNLQFRDLRASGITEASNAGMSLDDIRVPAGHSHASQTATYSRNVEIKTAEVQDARSKYRASGL